MKRTDTPRPEVRADDRVRSFPRGDLSRLGPFARL